MVSNTGLLLLIMLTLIQTYLIAYKIYALNLAASSCLVSSQKELCASLFKIVDLQVKVLAHLSH